MTWFAGNARGERCRAALLAHGLDALLALTPENAAYLSGQASTIATLWRVPGLAATAIGADGRMAIAAGDSELPNYSADRFARFGYRLWVERLDLRGRRETDLLARIDAARAGGAIVRPPQFDLDEVFAAVTAAVRAVAPVGRRVGADLATLPLASLERLRHLLDDIELVDATALLDDLRAIKDADEIAALRAAAELTCVGIDAARLALRPGLSELGVVAAYQTAIWRRAAAESQVPGLRRVEGLASVGGGEVRPGQTVKLDMQVNVDGYHSDVGRTYALAPTADQRAIASTLVIALTAAQAMVRPGVAFRDVHAAGIAAMHQADFSSYSRGHLGHSVGLAPNYEEPPFIAADEPRPLAPNMVISLELPYYLDGLGSFQFERMLLVTADGHEPLDPLPLDFAVG